MVPAESGNYSDPPTPKTQSLTFCLLFAYNRRVQVAGIPSRSLSFTPESLVPCRQPVRTLGLAEFCAGSMRYRTRSRGIRNGKSLGIPKGPDGIKRDFAVFSNGRAVPPGQFDLEPGETWESEVHHGVGERLRKFRRNALEFRGNAVEISALRCGKFGVTLWKVRRYPGVHLALKSTQRYAEMLNRLGQKILSESSSNYKMFDC